MTKKKGHKLTRPTLSIGWGSSIAEPTRAIGSNYHPYMSYITGKKDPIEEVNDQLEILRELVSKAIVEGAKQMAKDIAKEKDAKIEELARENEEQKEVIEAAKKSNWVENIKKNLTLR